MITLLRRYLLAIMLSTVLGASGLLAQQQTPSLGSFLNPDGTLNLASGFNGNLDARGWRLATSSSGEPRFEPIGGDEHWDDRFGPSGTNGVVNTILVSGTSVYIGGRFSLTGNAVASNVARWDMGSKLWSDVGGGLGDAVYALAISGDELYAGGIFRTSDANGYVARWNPSLSEWDILGDSGITPIIDPVWGLPDYLPGAYVYAMAVVGNDVYIGGDFDKADGVDSPNLIKWNRTTDKFAAVGAVGTVRSLVASGNRLYVGGTVASVAGVTVNNIAVYDSTTKVWAPLGSGLNDTVNTILLSGNTLYAGGAFTMAGTVATSHIASFNLTTGQWSPLGSGLSRPVRAMTLMGSDLYVGGEIMQSGVITANGIARWNGAAWSSLGSGVGANSPPAVNALGVGNGKLFIGGAFATAGTLTSRNIAGWDGEEWFQLAGHLLKELNNNGTRSAVFALAVSGEDVYIGGDFKRAGDVDANYIVRWNTASNSWHRLGTGIGGPAPFVRAIAVSGSNVYVGGIFTTAGGAPASGIARWNGSAWAPLGSGVGGTTPYVFAILPSGTDLYVGGAFTTAGGNSANRIARWNGTAWSPLGSGIGDATAYSTVNALAINGTDLFVGGDFTLAGGVVANRVARWNGSTWGSLGLGVNAPVSALQMMGTVLCAGGEFSMAGGTTANFIARWDGTKWSGFGAGFNAPVRALAVSGTDLYAGGEFTLSGTVPLGRIARWDGTRWNPMQVDSIGNGVNGPIRSIALAGSHVFAGGEFSIAGGLRANNIAEWDGTIWSSLGSDPTAGLEGTVLALVLKDSSVYVGGLFSSAGGMSASGIARWNGNNWIRLGRGVNGPVRSLAVIGNDIYAGGEFDSAGTVRAVGVARWDGAVWSPLGSGLGGPIPYAYALAARGTTLYVGGAFATAGGLGARRIAQYNTATQSWSTLGSGIGGAPFFTYVSALATASTGELYAGGIFPTIGDVTVDNIARWNGTAWSELSGGINNAVYVLAVAANDDLYVGGSFSAAGGVGVNNIVRWKGGAWEELGEGLAGDVNSLAFYDNDLFAGGSFTSSGAIGVNHVGRWNGVEWITMGGGVEKDSTAGRALALATYKDGVYVGGDFTIAGGRPSYYFGHWRRTPFLSAPTSHLPLASLDLRSYPNPVTSAATVAFALPSAGHATLTVTTLHGEEIATLVDEDLAAGEHMLRWDAAGFASGTYLYHLRCGDRAVTATLVVVR